MSHSVKLIRGAFTFLLLSVFISSGVSIASAAAYNAGTRTGDVSCTGGGNFTVVSGVVTGNSSCIGTATIPKEVTSIQDSAFAMATLLDSVFFESGSQLTSIGRVSFGYTGITSIRIPSGVTSLADYAFAYSASLYSIVFEPGSQLTSIGSQAFKSTTSLTSITIPTTVSSIGNSAFTDAGMPFTYTYCATGTASTVGAGLDNKTRNSTCTTEPGAPTIGTATATGTTTATVTFSAPTSNGGSTILSYTATSSPGGFTATITQAGSGTISITGLSTAISYTFAVTAQNAIGTSSASSASNSITTFVVGNSPIFTSGSSMNGQYTTQIKDYDSAFAYTATTTDGTASINSTGLVTVTGLSPHQSLTITVTTTRTGYGSGSGSVTGRAKATHLLPGSKPVVTISDTAIMCSVGTYSGAPSSSAFSLFVGGVHISTNFSTTGPYLPDWMTPWASPSTISRTASLTSASWAMLDSYKGKAITCVTLAYSNHATALTSSQALFVG